MAAGSGRMGPMRDSRPGRAPREARRLALLAGGITILAVALPLVAGYGGILASLARQLAAAGEQPAPSFWAPEPLHAARVAVLLLFALDLGLWISLLGLLPLDHVPGAPFLSLRRRLRRRWLLAMAPAYPVAAALAGARLLARAVGACGAGATWFLPGILGLDHGAGARAWISGERGLLAFFAAAFLLHLLFLAGPSRPARWLGRVAALLAAGALLQAASTRLLLPLVVGTPWRAAAVAREELLASFPALAGLDPIDRDDLAWNAFVRTAANGPALRGYPPWALPATVVALPPAPLAGLSGVPVRLPGRAPAGGKPGGTEWRLPLAGSPVPLPLPRPFHAVTVLKADRALPWDRVRALLRRIGPGDLRLGIAPVPCGPPRAVPPGPGPELVLREGSPPAGADPAARVPLPLPEGFPPPPARPGRPPRPGRVRPGRKDLFARERPTDVLWQRALPLPRPATPAADGTVRLVVPPAAPWGDVARAILAEILAGARRIELWTPGDGSSEAAEAGRPGRRVGLPGAERLPGVLDERLEDPVDRLVPVESPGGQPGQRGAGLRRFSPGQLGLHHLVQVDVEKGVLVGVRVGALPERPVLPVLLQDGQQPAFRVGQVLPVVPPGPQPPDRLPAGLREGPESLGVPAAVPGHRPSPASSRTRSGSSGAGAVALTTARCPSNRSREYFP